MQFDTPHEKQLTEIRELLIHWQARTDMLGDQIADLLHQGVYHYEGTPVIPGWWDRKDNGRTIAKYLVWPTAYAESTDTKRREYIRKEDIDSTQATINRTRKYQKLRDEYHSLQARLDQIGRELDRILTRHTSSQSNLW